MSQNPSSLSSTQTAQAPSWQLPFQQNALQNASAQFQNVTSPTQLVAPFAPQQNQAISNITSLANNNPTADAANNWVTNTLNGQPANNPYLNSEFNLAANQVQNRLGSEFAGSGRGVIGSLPIQSAELNNLATQLYGGAYGTGVQEQEAAAGLAPGAVNTSMGLQNGLFNAGGAIQNLGQQYITAPQNFLNQYLSQVNGNLGQTATTSYPLTPLQQFGMASTGANIGANLGTTLGNALGGSTGSSIGGLLGALGGGLLL